MEIHTFVTILLSSIAWSVMSSSPAMIEPKVMEDLGKAATTNVLVTFKKSDYRRTLAEFDSLRLETREARLNTLYQLQKNEADRIQENVLRLLEDTKSAKKHDPRQLWMSNELIVRNVDTQTVQLLAAHEDVKSIGAERFFTLEDNHVRELTGDTDNITNWGIEAIQADAVWKDGVRGEDVVVAIIDTGVRHTHEALRDNFRGAHEASNDYSWFSPRYLTTTPVDDNGHGTHVMGTLVGRTHNIGVAPNANWIACQICDSTFGCSRFDAIECGHWIGCPLTTYGSDPDCSKAPNLVSNSWSVDKPELLPGTFYDPIIEHWKRVGITSFFAAGNAGQFCGSVANPGDRPGTITVGATASCNVLYKRSSVGPTVDGRIKPDVVAPGVDIVSASNLSDDGYAVHKGTSMASPHAAGVATLMYSVNPNISPDEVLIGLTHGAQRIIARTERTCGGIKDTVYPNNHVGSGFVNAPASIKFVRSLSSRKL